MHMFQIQLDLHVHVISCFQLSRCKLMYVNLIKGHGNKMLTCTSRTCLRIIKV